MRSAAPTDRPVGAHPPRPENGQVGDRAWRLYLWPIGSTGAGDAPFHPFNACVTEGLGGSLRPMAAEGTQDVGRVAAALTKRWLESSTYTQQ